MIPRRRDLRVADQLVAEDERDACVRFIRSKAAKVRSVGNSEVAQHLTALADDLVADFHHDEIGGGA